MEKSYILEMMIEVQRGLWKKWNNGILGKTPIFHYSIN
jgi:hypothetical protein